MTERLLPSQRLSVVPQPDEVVSPTEIPLEEIYISKTYRGSEVFANVPRPRYIIPKLILVESLFAIYGQKGDGKTFYSLSQALEIARGGEWNGYKLKPRQVLYLVGEGSPAVAERLEAWRQFHELDKLPDNFFSSFIQPPPQLDEPEQVEAFIKTIRHYFPSAGGISYLDTFQTATVGLDEISGKDMGKAIDALKEIGRDTGTTIGIVHHAGKVLARGQRGHSSLGASMETEIEITKDRNLITARTEKMRTAEDGQSVSYSLHFVDLPPLVESEAEADGDLFQLERRSIPVLSPSSQTPQHYLNDEELVLINMLEGFDLRDGYKRTDGEKLLGKKRTPVGNLLKKLRDDGLITQLSPFSDRNSNSSYWLTDNGRALAVEQVARAVAKKIELNEAKEAR